MLCIQLFKGNIPQRLLKPEENMLPLELQIESHLKLILVAKWKQLVTKLNQCVRKKNCSFSHKVDSL